MAFRNFKVEPSRAIKINGKSWKTAHTAEKSYAYYSMWRFIEFYRRSHKIFTRYFKGN